MAFNGTITNDPLNFGGLGMTGGRRFRLSTIDFSTAYPVAGEALLASEFDLPVKIESITLVGITDGADVAQNFIFNSEGATLICIAADDGLLADDNTDLSGVSAKFLVIGY